MFYVVLGYSHRHTNTQEHSMASREQAIREAAEAFVHWLTEDEAVAA